MLERAIPYPDNIMPRLIYRKSMRETSVKPKLRLKRKRSHSYRSMERLPPSLWKLILQLSYERSFARLRSFSICICNKRPTVYALHPQIYVAELPLDPLLYKERASPLGEGEVLVFNVPFILSRVSLV